MISRMTRLREESTSATPEAQQSQRQQAWSAVHAILDTLIRDLDPHLNLIHLKTLAHIARSRAAGRTLEIRDVVKETRLDRRVVSRALKLLGDEGSQHKRSLNLVQMDAASDHRTRTVGLSPRGVQLADSMIDLLTALDPPDPRALRGLTAPVAVVVTNSDGRIRWVSAEFTQLWGFSRSEVYNRKPRELLHGPLTEEPMHNHLKQGVAARVPAEAIITNYRKDGIPQLARVEIRPVDGPERGFLATSRIAAT